MKHTHANAITNISIIIIPIIVITTSINPIIHHFEAEFLFI